MFFGKRAVAKKFGGKETNIVISGWPRKRKFNKLIAKSMTVKGAEGKIRFRLVTIKKNGIETVLFMVVKKFKQPLQPVQNQFEILNTLRKNTALREHIPPTVRLVENGRHPMLLLTDLTEKGKFLVKDPTDTFANKDFVRNEVIRLRSEMEKHGWIAWNQDEILVQTDPKINKAVKVWIVDAGTIQKTFDGMITKG